MLVALAAAIALATLWLSIVAIADTISANGGKIVAALKGQSLLAASQPLTRVRVRVSQRYAARRPVRTQPGLRAAA